MFVTLPLNVAVVAPAPAVALTAYAAPEDRRRALAAGYELHVPKPVTPEELVTAVANLSGRSAA